MNKILVTLLSFTLLGCSNSDKEKLEDSTSNTTIENTDRMDDSSYDLYEIDYPIDSLKKLHPEVYEFINKFELLASKNDWSAMVSMYEPAAYEIQTEEFGMSDAQFLYELLNLGRWNINSSEKDYQARINSIMSQITEVKVLKYSAESINPNKVKFEFYGNLTSSKKQLSIEIEVYQTKSSIYIFSAVG